MPLNGLLAGCKIRRFDGLTGAPGESQDKGKEAQEPWSPCQSIKPPYLTACFSGLSKGGPGTGQGQAQGRLRRAMNSASGNGPD